MLTFLDNTEKELLNQKKASRLVTEKEKNEKLFYLESEKVFRDFY